MISIVVPVGQLLSSQSKYITIMKRIIVMLLALAPFVCKAQSDTTNLKPKEQYCMVLATARMLSTKVNITVDFGQETKLFAFKDQRMKDEEGKVINFNSVIDALNYMATQGWVFVNAYAITVSGQNVLHYVLRRSLTN